MTNYLKDSLLWIGIIAIGWWAISGNSERLNGTLGDLVDHIPDQFVGEWQHIDSSRSAESVIVSPEGMWDYSEGLSTKRFPTKIYWSLEKNTLALHGDDFFGLFRGLSIREGKLFIQDVSADGAEDKGPFEKR